LPIPYLNLNLYFILSGSLETNTEGSIISHSLCVHQMPWAGSAMGGRRAA
jgi:hypothetical protein